MRAQTALSLLLVVGAASAIGCGGGTTTSDLGTSGAALRRAQTCTDLLSELQNDAILKLEKAVARQIQQIRVCQTVRGANAQECAYAGYGGGIGFGGAANDSGGRAESGTAAPMAPGSGSGSGSSSTGSSSGGSSSGGTSSGSSSSSGGTSAPVGTADPSRTYTDTNTQVQGVDEADIVKTDGTHLFVLHGSQLKVVRAFPSDTMAELAQVAIEGSPLEMYVADGKAVVYSRVNGGALFQAAGITPRPSYADYGYGYGGGGGASVDVAVPSTPGGGGSTGGTTVPYVPMTKITVFALTATGGTVQRESYFEGNYLSSRRVGAHVRTVLSGGAHGPKLKYSVYEYDGSGTPPVQPQTGDEAIAQIAQLRDQNKAILRASQLADWVPTTFTKNGGTVVASSVACSDAYVPTAGSTTFGLTEVATIDLGNPTGLPRETAIFGQADTVYASADSLYLAGRGYVDLPAIGWIGSVGVGSGGATATPPPVDPSTPQTDPSSSSSSSGGSSSGSFGTPRPASLGFRSDPATAAPSPSIPANLTHVHKLDLTADPSFPTYVGSGTVAGSVNDQFALDERNGDLRIATTENRVYLDEVQWFDAPTTTPPSQAERQRSFTHVTVLRRNGGTLARIGGVRDLAPGERIYSTRFVGPRGYVVTFRQVDPLFVIDLAQPTAPKVLGELKIPGFSEYMHPLDDGHLLTIGREASNEGRVQGLALQLFDVTDGTNPKLLHKHVYTGSEYGSSEASQNHKAFTYYAEKKLLAFPYTSYARSSNGSGGPTSTLELFHVDLASGFSKVGALDHSTLVARTGTKCGYASYDPTVRRGLFIENIVYAISYGGIVAKPVNLLGTPGASLPFEAPSFDPNDGSGGAPRAPEPTCAPGTGGGDPDVPAPLPG